MKNSHKRTSWLQVVKLAGVLAVGIIVYAGLILIDTA
ncbi:hypothetical protein AEAC466_01895 [Asticcacaulis sp. AC466]|nr:hypothetical protein AEAC466_01895 [Asticcacaulis sp. AC466]